MRLVIYEGLCSLELPEDAMPGWRVPLSNGVLGIVSDNDVPLLPVTVVGDPHPPVLRGKDLAFTQVEVGRGFLWRDDVGVRISEWEYVWRNGIWSVGDIGLVKSCMIRVPKCSGWCCVDDVWTYDAGVPGLAPSCELEGTIFG